MQQKRFSKDELIFLTTEWKGERFEDGKPKVSDALYFGDAKILIAHFFTQSNS